MVARRMAAVSVLALAAACSQAAPPAPKPDAAAVKATIGAWWKQIAAYDTACNTAAIGGMMASDVVMDGTGGPTLHGRSAWEGVIKDLCKTSRVTSETINATDDWADGDHLYERGSYSEVIMTGSKGKTQFGRYFARFDKDSAGKVLMSRVTWIIDSIPVLKPTPSKAPAKTPAKAPAKKAPSKKS